MPSHSHTYAKASFRDKGASSEVISAYTTSDTSTSSTGGSSSHTHTLSGTASIALNVKYTDVIICSKN